ncbi:XVIPCD domain-containing protein [Marilutibacter alkalisoli]|uniref:X-Tfes XVIPCD domain-containing protein n=1 Tax=Marilutibacter alkalisoli TaxID=2591633 RepID=A0A514BSH7_9GAMM|nr:XVIPCD domain-containing protein [Lysobacter alkalisoli]QDH70352.1 hypothetical protein FKV23_09805 [Lysobacter alkalisoli]
MMDHGPQIERIRNATSLEEIREVVREFSAKATGDGGVLYSRPVGDVPSESIAKELARQAGLPIINDTPRAKFLSSADDIISESAERIFRANGQSLAQAEKSKMAFLYGDSKAAVNSATSLDNCLWGEASREFAGSLRGDVKVVASNANIERVFGKVELPTLLENPNVRSLGGQPIAELKVLYVQGGAEAVLPKVQAPFIEAAPKGLFSLPDTTGAKVSKVTLSREFASAMDIDANQLSRFASSAEIRASGLTRAPIGFGAQGVAIGETALAAEAAATRQGLRPGTGMKALGAAGVIVSIYDAADTVHGMSQLRGQGNNTAAQSRIERFAVQNVTGWGGAAAGMAGGAAAGVTSGPGLLVTGAIGGIVGAVAGDKVADWLDERKINRQQDPEGRTWTFDPKHPEKGWTHQERTIDAEAMRYHTRDSTLYKTRTLTADPALSDRLDYQASSTSVELALGAPPRSRDPYTLQAGDQDARSAREAAWTRDPDTQQWSREVSRLVDYRINSAVYKTERVEASPERAAELEAASQAIIAQNAAQTPAAMAATFQQIHEQNGWAQHGSVPDAVTQALQNPGRVVGSNGRLYQRDAEGQWTHDGLLWDSQAKGNLRQELEATYQQQQAEARIPTLDTVRVTASPAIDAPETTTTRDPRVSQFLAALEAGDEQGMREASIAFAESERGQQIVAEAEQRVWDQQQQLSGRDHPLFGQALEQLEKAGPEVGGYLDRLQMESVAGALAHEAQVRHMPGIDGLALSRDGQTLMATWTHPHNNVLDRHCTVDRFQAGIQPLDQSLQDLAAETQRQEEQALLQAQQRQMQQETALSR